MDTVVILGVLCFVTIVLLGMRHRERRRQAMLQSMWDELVDLSRRIDGLVRSHRQQEEDLRVLAHTLLEKGVADEEDLEEVRRRCVERPLRLFEERAELLERAGISVDDHRVVDDEHGTVH
ncbi:MAG: hypothetical protein D6729_05075 [Deltaproteobacteria bacterium]|nr:MAG: hypothetical protein D6729_05075 [Deltaproteobacteria bacterium]